MAFSIAPGTIEAAITVGINVVNRFFQEKTKKKEDLVSVGLAVGYFFFSPKSTASGTLVIDII